MKTRSSAQQNPGAQLNLEDSFASAESESEIEETMAFDNENGIDDSGAHSKLASAKVAYDASDPEFFFINLESAMSYAGIKSQQSKRFCLLGVLPNEVKIQFKGIIKATATGELGYKKVKSAVLEVFGPKPGEDCEKASNLLLKDKPSMLANEIISLVCQHSTPLDNCCCENAVLWLWKRQLPNAVKARIAGKTLKGGDNLKEVLKLADAVFETTRRPTPQVAATSESGGPNQSDSTVAALARGRGRGNRSRGRGRGRGGYNSQPRQTGTGQQTTTQSWGPRHQDNPPEGCCRAHWRWGNGAYFCSDRATCPWKDRITPRPPQQQNAPV